MFCLITTGLLGALNEPDQRYVHFITGECVSEMMVSGQISVSSETLYSSIQEGFSVLVESYKSKKWKLYFAAQSAMNDYCPKAVNIFDKSINQVYPIKGGE